MASRRNLQNRLEAILGSTNVYFQAPESLKMKYPCIRYNLDGIDADYADDSPYHISHRYTVMLIHENPDNTLKEQLLLAFKHIKMTGRPYVSNNLYHYIYTLYFDEEE